MDNAWITGILIFIIGYYLIKVYSKGKNNETKVNVMHSDILNNDEYKIKGQWEK